MVDSTHLVEDLAAERTIDPHTTPVLVGTLAVLYGSLLVMCGQP